MTAKRTVEIELPEPLAEAVEARAGGEDGLTAFVERAVSRELLGDGPWTDEESLRAVVRESLADPRPSRPAKAAFEDLDAYMRRRLGHDAT